MRRSSATLEPGARNRIPRDSLLSARTALRVFSGAVLCCIILAGLPVSVSANGNGAGIEHIVIVWMNEPGNPADRERITAASRVLTGIPGVTGLRSGRMIPSERAIVDSSFDVALIVSLADRDALQAYLTHPVHVRLVEETLKPLVKKIRVYDIGP